jgi:tetratricopeptide (TPR) repeat protein
MPKMNDYSKRVRLLKRIWIVAKLLYLHMAYFFVGMTEEQFHITKGNYFLDLHWFHRAIPNYQKALRETPDPMIHLTLGFCLMQIGKFHDSVKHYRIAYAKLNKSDVALGLAISEYETGNIDRCRELVQQLEGKEHQLYLTNEAALEKLKGKLEEKSKAQA